MTSINLDGTDFLQNLENYEETKKPDSNMGSEYLYVEVEVEGALVRKANVEVLWEPGNFQDDGARVGVCFASNTDLELWTDGVEQGVIDNMIVFQKPFPATRSL